MSLLSTLLSPPLYYGESPPPVTEWVTNPFGAFIQTALYYFAMLLYYLAELVNLLFSTVEGIISGIVGVFVQAVTGLGILSLPVFIILIFSFFSFGLIFMMVLHDLPIVGAVA